MTLKAAAWCATGVEGWAARSGCVQPCSGLHHLQPLSFFSASTTSGITASRPAPLWAVRQSVRPDFSMSRASFSSRSGGRGNTGNRPAVPWRESSPPRGRASSRLSRGTALAAAAAGVATSRPTWAPASGAPGRLDAVSARGSGLGCGASGSATVVLGDSAACGARAGAAGACKRRSAGGCGAASGVGKVGATAAGVDDKAGAACNGVAMRFSRILSGAGTAAGTGAAG